MKKNLYPLLATAVVLATTLPSMVFAAPYVPLEPLPFLSSSGYGTNLPALLQALFRLLIIGGAGVATLMITIGGIQYMTSDALHQKAEGRARIQNSVFGLLLLLGIYLILRTINPQLLNFDLSQIVPVGQRSDEMVRQAKQTQAQREAAAASPGPAASSAIRAGSPGNLSGGDGVCPPGDVFCNGSGLGIPSNNSQNSFYAPTPDFRSADYDSFPYAIQSSEPPPPVSTESFGVRADTSGSELSGTQFAPNTQDTYAYSGAVTTLGLTSGAPGISWSNSYGFKDTSYVRFFPDQKTCMTYAIVEAQDQASACKKN